jgi:negative regulator of sigma E activity
MLQHRDNLIKIGSTMSDTRFNIIIMSSLPESYRPAIQTITAVEQANKLSGLQSNTMSADDLITFIIEEAQHQVINNEHTKNAESVLPLIQKNLETLKGRKRSKANQT